MISRFLWCNSTLCIWCCIFDDSAHFIVLWSSRMTFAYVSLSPSISDCITCFSLINSSFCFLSSISCSYLYFNLHDQEISPFNILWEALILLFFLTLYCKIYLSLSQIGISLSLIHQLVNLFQLISWRIFLTFFFLFSFLWITHDVKQLRGVLKYI